LPENQIYPFSAFRIPLNHSHANISAGL